MNRAPVSTTVQPRLYLGAGTAVKQICVQRCFATGVAGGGAFLPTSNRVENYDLTHFGCELGLGPFSVVTTIL